MRLSSRFSLRRAGFGLALACGVLAAPVAAKPPLNTVSEIDDAVMMVMIANEIQQRCGDINGRMLRGIAELEGLKSKAASMGYSRAEIKAYTTSKSEKARMRSKAEGWLAGQGVARGDTGALCRFGKAQMASGSAIGRLLR